LLRRLCVPLLVLLAPAAEAATVYVDATGVQVSGGLVFAGLCTGGLEDQSCTFGQSAPSRTPSLRFVFPQVPPGTYAVAVFQDVNGNGRLDRTPLGLPLEPYGFSNDAGRLRRPNFPAAAVEVGESDVQVGVRLAPIPQAR
jgi:uncharacterized protein (DUF2141 family)